MSLQLVNTIFLEVIQAKWDRVTQESRWDVEIEGDRRRTSMVVINVLDWTQYLACVADFILTIADTMVEGQRPPPPNRNDNRPGGRMIRFEEGILCQVRNVLTRKIKPTNLMPTIFHTNFYNFR